MIKVKHARGLCLVGALCAVSASCQDLPGNERQQGAVIGGVGGAVLGHAIGDGALGALIGGLAGAAGGYLIGAEMEKVDERSRDEARESIESAQYDPATPADVQNSSTADLNSDGFVTMDELVAMSRAGLDDEEILDRLDATGQVFELNASQEEALRDAGISSYVVNRMQELNQDGRDKLGLGQGEVLGRSQ